VARARARRGGLAQEDFDVMKIGETRAIVPKATHMSLEPDASPRSARRARPLRGVSAPEYFRKLDAERRYPRNSWRRSRARGGSRR
jgi:hypothetical protein